LDSELLRKKADMKRLLWLWLWPATTSLFAAGFTTSIDDSFVYKVAAMTADSAGYTYVTGSRQFVVSPQTGGWLPDVFLTKLDPSGKIVFTSTFAGKASDQANALALDPAGNIYVGGVTSSPDFPLFNPLQNQGTTPAGGSTGFVVKFNPRGAILYSTYFGGTQGWSSVNGLATDSQGNLYLAGTTGAFDFPQTSGLPRGTLSNAGSSGAFVAEISAAGDRILYSGMIVGSVLACSPGSTCFLSAHVTTGIGIAVDPGGSVYLAGNTNTLDLPVTPGALLGQGIGAFVAKIKPGGAGLAYLTYLGSLFFTLYPRVNPANILSAIAVDAAGNAYLAGSTEDPAFPVTPGAYQTTFGGGPVRDPLSGPPPDAFLAKLKPDGSAMVWATYLGGTGSDSAQAITVDAGGNVWAAGTTASSTFPNSSGWTSGADFLVGLNSSGTALVAAARYPSGAVAQAVAANGTGGLVYAAGSGGIVSATTPAQPATAAVFGITNGAGGSLAGRIAVGEVISIYGPQLGPSSAATGSFDASGFLPTSLGGVTVSIGGRLASLLYVSSTQINAVVPFEENFGPVDVVVTSSNGTTPAFRAYVAVAVPDIAQNLDGSAAALNQNGSVNSPSNPAQPGSVISVWATGVIPLSLTDGQMQTAANPLCFLCFIQADHETDVMYAGAAPGMVAGIVQINFRLPAEISSSQYSFALLVYGYLGRNTFVYIAPNVSQAGQQGQ
jgi:uncharacterized protein (TIGR03437 family)